MSFIMPSIAAALATTLFTSAVACTDSDVTEATAHTSERAQPTDWHPDYDVREVRPGIHELAYTDITGAPRRFLAEVRTPTERRGSRPVVVWSHGGSSGKTSTARVGEEWGRAINQAEFVFVAIAHPSRSTDSRSALCDAVDAANCAEFKYLLWDRLHDAKVVFDWLEDAAAAGDEFVDMDRLVYGGHSAGAMAAMAMAGMESPFETGVPLPTDERPMAFLAGSPPGAEANGLDANSFIELDRPVLLLTGEEDTTNGTGGSDRIDAFELIEHDEVMLVSTDSEHVGHSTFDFNAEPCRREGGTRQECRTMVRSLAKVAQRFLTSAMSAEGLDTAGLISATAGHLPNGMQLRVAS